MFNKLEVELTKIYPPNNNLRKTAYEIAIRGYEFEQATDSSHCHQASFRNVVNLLGFYFRYLDDDNKEAATRYKKVKDGKGLATILLEGVSHWNEDDIEAFYRHYQAISDKGLMYRFMSQVSVSIINTFWGVDAEKDELLLANTLLNVASVYRLAGYNVVLNLPRKSFTLYAHDVN